jgi:hypothetical protein
LIELVKKAVAIIISTELMTGRSRRRGLLDVIPFIRQAAIGEVLRGGLELVGEFVRRLEVISRNL